MTRQIIDCRYDIRPALGELLARLFPGRTCPVKIRRGQVIIDVPRPLTPEEIDSCRY
ncbi:hypothetical protein OIDMADRAFT_20489 [Oidiodendron maius Zn]|uniref:Uncharacterized protein n=1 Tax=Oidiodendron maius (strain Zn) TaxID=913774 RepID=A0A0C3H4A5_OIDMZ|nr:hypothetical protein OIDMADRAFT_20489 [Oidiodendron maius Zn]